MAYRRKQGAALGRSTTFKEEILSQNDDNENEDGSLAARAIRASAAHRDSAAYGYAYAADSSSSSSSPSASASASTSYSRSDSVSHRQPHSPFPSLSNSQGSFHSESHLTKDADKSSTYGFWGILAQKGKSILDGDDLTNSPKHQVNDTTGRNQLYQSPDQPPEGGSRIDNTKLRKRFDSLTSSLNNLGDSIGNAFEEGRSLVGNKTADIIHETRKIQIRRRGVSSDAQDQATVVQNSSWQRPVIQPTVSNNNQGTQLKASRDVAMATAAKAKVLLRELKAVKAELAFAKQRCAQLEEENKRLRESREKGENPADDDLIRLQLESLLAEKARLAHENALHARENRFLREIVEYHRLTMQDLVCLEEGAEDVSEDYPFSIEDTQTLSTPTSPMSPFFQEVSSLFPTQIKEHIPEVPKDELDNTTSSPSISKPSPLGFQPESSEDPTTLQKVEDKVSDTLQSTNPANARDGDEKRPSVS